MISTLIKKIFGTSHEREIKRLLPLVAKVNELEPAWQKKSDAELQGITGVFYQRLDRGEPLDQILPEAFATVREASRRVLGMRHYDVQLLGGMVLHRGAISEMKTGEGKTLVATSPLYLNALERKGAHLVTVNDYLATRDAEWMGRVYRFLGMDIGVVIAGQSDAEKQKAYRAHITYGTNNEFGFDYLRDNMKNSIERYVQRNLHYAIVDEVDSILIDEARTPLIISGPAEQSAALYYQVNRVIPSLRKDVDYTVDEKHHSVALTDVGIEKVEQKLGIGNLYDANNLDYNHHLQQALRAHTLYKRDVNYVVNEQGQVVIIDEFTGRLMPGRRWSDGLHQAVEAKENVKIEEETQTLATISFQNLFRLYKKLGGMTGTADTEAEEFHKIYKLDVVSIPTHRAMVRRDLPDLVYKNEAGKFRAVIKEVEDAYRRGQPVLVGTVSVEKSEVLSVMLKRKGIPHTVLNAKQHAREAAVVAQAGRQGAITIATNMAGRGTDILLGGNPEFMARAEVYGEEAACRPGACDETTPEYKQALLQFKTITEQEKEKVRALGGLHIIGTERHESRRIDNQLRGRAGRQGDPGSSRFYLSLEDDLLRIFGAGRLSSMMDRLGMEEDVPIEAGMITRAIENAQRKVEAHHFDGRKHLLEYDDVMNQQRKAIYHLRRQILEGRYIRESDAKGMKEGLVPAKSGELDQKTLAERLKTAFIPLIDAYDTATHPASVQASSEETPKQVPGPEALTHEIYRQFGAAIDFRSVHQDKAKMLALACNETAISLIQQRERILDMAEQVVGSLVATYCPDGKPSEEWDLEGLSQAVREQFHVEISLNHLSSDTQEIAEKIWEQVETYTKAREVELGLYFLYLARHFLLEEIDTQWIAHLKTMDHLREGIGLRGYGQKDPKQEYKREGFALFQEMMDRLLFNGLKKLYWVQIEQRPSQGISSQAASPMPELKHKERPMVAQHVGSSTSGGDEPSSSDASAQQRGTTPVHRDAPKVGRNDPCPCGSGKKYKKCHGVNA